MILVSWHEPCLVVNDLELLSGDLGVSTSSESSWMLHASSSTLAENIRRKSFLTEDALELITLMTSQSRDPVCGWLLRPCVTSHPVLRLCTSLPSISRVHDKMWGILSAHNGSVLSLGCVYCWVQLACFPTVPDRRNE